MRGYVYEECVGWIRLPIISQLIVTTDIYGLNIYGCIVLRIVQSIVIIQHIDSLWFFLFSMTLSCQEDTLMFSNWKQGKCEVWNPNFSTRLFPVRKPISWCLHTLNVNHLSTLQGNPQEGDEAAQELPWLTRQNLTDSMWYKTQSPKEMIVLMVSSIHTMHGPHRL